MATGRFQTRLWSSLVSIIINILGSSASFGLHHLSGTRRSIGRISTTRCSLRSSASVEQRRPSSSIMVSHRDDTTASSPLCSIGVIADIQWAPIPNGTSFSGAPRYYRHALNVAEQAAQHFQEEHVLAAINLGDLVDGKCQSIAQHGGDIQPYANADVGRAVTQQVLTRLAAYQHGPWLHTYGNHCLYNLDRSSIQNMLQLPFVTGSDGELVGYYTHLLEGRQDNDDDTARRIRIVVVDSYDVAKLRRSPDSVQYQAACEIIRRNNPNEQENSPEGLEGVEKRFVAFNGAVGDTQLAWLQRTLQAARDAHEAVLVISHQPIHPASSNPVCLMWNYPAVLDVLREYNDIVLLSLAGHAHKGGYHQDDSSGIHFRVVEAVLESPPPICTYGILHVYWDRVELQGIGDCESAVYQLSDAHMWTKQRATQPSSRIT